MASPDTAAATSSRKVSRTSMAPVAATAPAVKSSESPGRNGQMTSPVSMKMTRKRIA
jgi:hypothetical protein